MGTPATNVAVEITPTVAFRNPNFRFFVLTRFLTTTASEMQSVAVAWQVYNLTHRPMDLGYVGLAQFLPGILLFLVAGHVADRFSRIKILVTCYSLFSLCSLALLTFSLRGITSVYSIYAVLLVNGAVRAFNWPAGMAFLPRLVPKEHFPNAVTWNSSIFQGATLCGPNSGRRDLRRHRECHHRVHVEREPRICWDCCRTLQIRVPASTGQRRGILEGHGAGRIPLHLSEQADPRLHFTRSLCRVSGRRGCVAADLRERHPESGRNRTGHSAQRPRSGCNPHGHPSRLQAAAAQGGSDHALLGGRIRCVYHPVWYLPQPVAFRAGFSRW